MIDAVHQALPSLDPGDATGGCALALRAALLRSGLRADIFAESVHPALAGRARPLAELPAAGAGQTVLLHYAVASPATDAVLGTPARRRALVYHNLTPDYFFATVSRSNRERVRAARLELPWLAPEFDLALAPSEFSRGELVEAGFRSTAVLPLAVDAPHGFDARPEPGLVLGVGRISPNKRWELAVRAVAALRRETPEVRLEIVGATAEMERYARALEELADALDAGLTLRGKVGADTLESAWARASVLVLPSAHEGFGLPPLEAMVRGVPVVATAHGALPEVIGDAGLLCRDDPLEIAAALGAVLRSPATRAALATAGRRRAALFDTAALDRRLAGLLPSLTAA